MDRGVECIYAQNVCHGTAPKFQIGKITSESQNFTEFQSRPYNNATTMTRGEREGECVPS